MLITDYNQAVQEGNIELFPCAYLHNYRRVENDPLDDLNLLHLYPFRDIMEVQKKCLD